MEMPRNIEKISQDIANGVTSEEKATPHFFDNSITGNGKNSRGMLNANLHPGAWTPGTTKCTTVNLNRRRTIHGEGVAVQVRPTAVLHQDAYTLFSPTNSADPALRLPVPSKDSMFELSTTDPAMDWDVYLNLNPQALMIHEISTRDGKRTHLDVAYRMEIYLLKKGEDKPAVPVVKELSALNFSRVHVDFTQYPVDYLDDTLGSLTTDITSTGKALVIDQDALTAWLEDYNVYDAVAAQAEVWNGDGLMEEFEVLLDSVFPDKDQTTDKELSEKSSALNGLAMQMRYFESYAKVPLASYEKIHQLLRTYCPERVVDVLCKQNINLMLNQSLQELREVKDKLVTVPSPQTPVSINPRFSPQQKNAITATGPLDLVQAGAGTGKSTVILGRVEYMVACGVKEEDITVLSFTNVAADNISARNPRIGSMTIARMILEIYEANYSDHRISDIDTIINSLEIYNGTDEFVQVFVGLLQEVDKSAPGSTTALNAFVEANFDYVMFLLDRIRQTCLELQIIVAYQKIYDMVEPESIRSKYLIIDEVQDTSIFEFIYMLKYVTKHEQSLFIVGDAAQTLYEFRGANTRALNALEASGIFDTHQLTTNYRSNQSILDFANVGLRDISANSAAQLQLRANIIERTTLEGFRNAVQLHMDVVKTEKEYKDEYLAGTMLHVLAPYVQEKRAAGEQIAFIAYARRDVEMIREFLETHFPGEKIASLVSDRHHPTTVFSQLVKTQWDSVVNAGPDRVTMTVVSLMTEKIEELSATKGRSRTISEAQRNAVRNMAHEWYVKNTQAIGGWLQSLRNNLMTEEQYFELVKESLLQYEINKNSARKLVVQQRNEQKKGDNNYQNSPFVISTIHGAKGMEFQNVVVIHKDKPAMGEDMKQMYYVALTRAMKSELIISHSTQQKPRIQSDYLNLCHELLVNDVRDLIINDQGDPDDEDTFETYREQLVKQYQDSEVLPRGLAK